MLKKIDIGSETLVVMQDYIMYFKRFARARNIQI